MNARDQIKPKSIRLSILMALSDGAIATIDDLQTKMDEPRKKVANNVFQTVVDGLTKRLRDDVTGGPAYQITTKGRSHLEKFADGKVEEPQADETADVTPGVKADIPPHEDVRISDKAAEIIGSKDAEIVLLREARDDARVLVSRMHAAAVGEIRAPHLGVVEDVEELRRQRNSWREMAGAFGCVTPQDIANRFSELAGVIASPPAAPTAYVLQRPAKPLVRFSKRNSAETRAMAFARTGQRAQVFALVPVGVAVPGAEWRGA